MPLYSRLAAFVLVPLGAFIGLAIASGGESCA
jgi:hypothetical protein